MAESLSSVLIVLIVFSFVSFSVYMKYRTEQLKNTSVTFKDSLSDENRALQQKVSRLEDRIKVLESIVTSKEFSLKEQIDALS